MSQGERVATLLERGAHGERLNADEALMLYQAANLFDLGAAAHQRRMGLHPEPVATFVVDRIIAYTNICTADCSFCAFYRRPNDEDTYLIPKNDILERVQLLVDEGGTQVMLQGGLHPRLDLGYYVDLCASIKAAYPQVDLHSFSPPEIDNIARVSKLTIRDVLMALREVGLETLPGGGAELLNDRVRDIVSPKKQSAATWLEVIRIAHDLGMYTSSTMVYGMVETPEERIDHMLTLRDEQDRSGLFQSFIIWSFQPGNSELQLPAAPGAEYLRMVSLSRLFLDNIPHIQAGWLTEGPKLGQMALRFGADDFGGTIAEDKVISATGLVYTQSIRDAVRAIRGSGFRPAQRTTRYRIVQWFDEPQNSKDRGHSTEEHQPPDREATAAMA